MEAGTDFFGTIVVFAEVHLNLREKQIHQFVERYSTSVLQYFFYLYVFLFWIYYVLASAILCSNK